MLALFENYSSSTKYKNNKDLESITIALNYLSAKTKLLSKLENQHPDELQVLDNSREIYVYDKGFEVTYEFVTLENQSLLINVTVYGVSKRGRTRSYLKRVLAETRTLYREYLK